MIRETLLVLGLAREGESLARYFHAHGARVIVTDRSSAEALAPRLARLDPAIELRLGGDFPELTRDADRFFVSPGVPPTNPVYAAARERALPVESMTTLFFDLCPAPIVGVTGSSGKTTTTSLIGHLLRAAGEDTVVGGNIGDPMLDLLPHVKPETRVVLELSSFQLETLERSPHVAVVTNISPNHLDRHLTMEAYVAAKRHIVQHQRRSDLAVLNAGDPASSTFLDVTPAQPRWFGQDLGSHSGLTVEADQIVRRTGHEVTPIVPISCVPLLGRHNLENVLAALAGVEALGVSLASAPRAIESFRPPSHRLQTVAIRCGVRYIDDSIATSPARAAVALEAVAGPLVLIAGGRDKNLPWDEFAALAARRTQALILLGESAAQIEAAVRARLNGSGLRASGIVHAGSLEEAVGVAASLAPPGGAVLLSPGCTSFDMFKDFEARGAAFARAVEALDGN